LGSGVVDVEYARKRSLRHFGSDDLRMHLADAANAEHSDANRHVVSLPE